MNDVCEWVGVWGECMRQQTKGSLRKTCRVSPLLAGMGVLGLELRLSALVASCLPLPSPLVIPSASFLLMGQLDNGTQGHVSAFSLGTIVL